MGITRFAYALILPAMRDSFAWSYAEAGALNASNSVGYLAGALAGAAVIARLGAFGAFAGGTALTAVAIFFTGFLDTFPALVAFRVLPGFTAAIAFVAGGVLVARAAASLGSASSFAVGLFYTGPGVGVVVSGLVVPPLLDEPAAWRQAWYALGIAAGVLGIAATITARRVSSHRRTAEAGSPRPGVSLRPAILAYGFFAAGYIGYLTFIIALVREWGGSPSEASAAWIALGVASITSFFVWRRVLAAAGGGSLALLISTTAVASGLPLLGHQPVLLLASCVLFGGTFLVVVAATTNLVRVARTEPEWPRWIGAFTIAFGAGQTVGPLLGGAAADALSGSDAVLWVSTGLLACGAAIALLQRRPG